MDNKQFIRDFFEPYFHTSSSMDDRMVGIMHKRADYEKRLDEMWAVFLRGNLKQLPIYKDQVRYIKEANLKVLRSKSTGKHMIVYKNGGD